MVDRHRRWRVTNACTEVVRGLAGNGFKNIVMINGHGGNTEALNAIGEQVGREMKVRTLVVNWWAYCSDITMKVFGERNPSILSNALN